jgi:redox-sensitive bicupin YhaK (pirin superfamily)
MHKTVNRAEALQFEPAFPGLSGVNVFAHHYPIEPVLVLTEFHMRKPVFGPHPHAGISVITYMLPGSEGSFINRDSRGDHSIIKTGCPLFSAATAGSRLRN